MRTRKIAVNGHDILIFTKGEEQYVAIKAICEAIGVNYDNQIEKINNDEILNQLTPIRGVVGADGRNRQMRVIPLRFVFGWIFTISTKKVKPEIREQMATYKMECYNALFDTFTKRTAVLKERTEIQIKIDDLEESLRKDPRQIQINELKRSRTATTKQLNTLDKDVITEQYHLFNQPPETEPHED